MKDRRPAPPLYVGGARDIDRHGRDARGVQVRRCRRREVDRAPSILGRSPPSTHFWPRKTAHSARMPPGRRRNCRRGKASPSHQRGRTRGCADPRARRRPCAISSGERSRAQILAPGISRGDDPAEKARRGADLEAFVSSSRTKEASRSWGESFSPGSTISRYARRSSPSHASETSAAPLLRPIPRPYVAWATLREVAGRSPTWRWNGGPDAAVRQTSSRVYSKVQSAGTTSAADPPSGVGRERATVRQDLGDLVLIGCRQRVHNSSHVRVNSPVALAV